MFAATVVRFAVAKKAKPGAVGATDLQKEIIAASISFKAAIAIGSHCHFYWCRTTFTTAGDSCYSFVVGSSSWLPMVVHSTRRQATHHQTATGLDITAWSTAAIGPSAVAVPVRQLKHCRHQDTSFSSQLLLHTAVDTSFERDSA